MDLSNILFIDTESNPETKKPECIQWLINNEKGIIEEFTDTTFSFLKSKWDTAKAIIMFNAPYDIGALSIFYPKNNYKWVIQELEENNKSSAWNITLFDNVYMVRRISFFRNLIKPRNRLTGKKQSHHKGKYIKGIKSTPIIDLLKLWSILILDDESISLKALIKREIHRQPIEYSEANSKTEAYRFQDVMALKELTELFFNKIKPLKEIKDFTIDDWSFIKTPATFTKILYEKEYPLLKEYQKDNDIILDELDLKKAFENAFHGGITLSMYRGELNNTGWIDIKGAYSKAIEVLNTDSYLRFRIEKGNKLQFEKPQLLKIKTNFMFKSMNKSLKLFYIEEKSDTYIINYDIISCQNLAEKYEYEILEIWNIIPDLFITESLPVTWNRLKDIEKNNNGKTTLYNFYKYLSNTSYGIKAQRKPFVTKHTNMVIASIITAKVHQILTTIIKTVKDYGCKNKYNDTDSSCFQYKKFNPEMINTVNKNIYPFEVDHEGNYDKTIILSLKRYISIHDMSIFNEKGLSKHDKVKLHGKGRYKINMKEISNYVLTKTIDKDEYMVYTQMSANTAISMKMILKIYPFLQEYSHPFMFVKNVKTDVLKSEFLAGWYNHIDTKTGWTIKSKNFERDFHNFKNIREAEMFFKNYSIDMAEDINECFRDWDKEISEDFKL